MAGRQLPELYWWVADENLPDLPLPGRGPAWPSWFRCIG
jgi:hypothetical protein